jgi:hypothetical protein
MRLGRRFFLSMFPEMALLYGARRIY